LRAPDEKFERPVEAPAHRLGRQELRARRSQLDGERQPVEPRADLRYCRGVVVVELELGVHCHGTGGEQPHRVVLDQLLEAQLAARLRRRERRDRVLVLPGEPQRRPARGEHEQPRRRREQAGDEPHVRHELLEVVEQQEHAPVVEVGREDVLHRIACLAHTERLCERGSEQCGVVHGGEVDEDGAITQLRPELRSGGEREPRLARSARARERDETYVPAPKERGDRGHLEAATHERSRRRGQLHAHGGRRLRCRQRGIVLQDPALELLELRAGVDAELFDEQLTGRPACGERVGLPSRAIERKRVLRARVLAVRLGRDHPLQLGHELVVAAERELCIVEEVDGPQPLFLELSSLGRVDGLAGEIGQGLATPEIERAAQVLGRIRSPPRGERCGGPVDESLEPAEVERRRIEVEAIAGAVPLDALAPQRPAEAVHVHLQRGDCRVRRLGSPQRVDEAVPRHDRVRIQQQQGQEGALLRGSERQRAVVPDGLDRAQDTEFHARRPLSQPAAKRILSGSFDGVPDTRSEPKEPT
jgi:hypothetical protein